MCGGVSFSFSVVEEDELKHFYKPEEISYFKKTGEVQSFFWQEKPALPAQIGERVKLFNWGNRDKNVNLPKTGWARRESLATKKWSYLKPEFVAIPVNKGYEKRVWFNLNYKILGILVKKANIQVIYMVTKEADKAYLKLTHHPRMPVCYNNPSITPL